MITPATKAPRRGRGWGLEDRRRGYPVPLLKVTGLDLKIDEAPEFLDQKPRSILVVWLCLGLLLLDGLLLHRDVHHRRWYRWGAV